MYQRVLCAFAVLYFVITVRTEVDSSSARVSSKLEKDDGKSSLVFVFDTTGSMYNDLRQLKESAEMILNTALEESHIIADFVFVPFHDPGVGPPTVTKHKSVFKAALNIVRVYGGGDCPEKCLSGVLMALEVSRPRSFVYVFTDATAGDHRLVGKVLDSVQRKQSQVVFVLTGHCNDLKRPSYQVYEQIAAASSGQVFNLNKTNVHKVLEMVRTSINGRNVNLGSSIRPAGYNHTQGIPVDSTVGEVTVSVSGTKPQIRVVDPKGKELTGPPKLITTLDLSEIMVVKVMQPEPGNWSVTVGSARDYSVRVAGLSNLTFSHGFSAAPPQTMAETSHRPLKGTYNHMMISLSETDAPVTIDYAEILTLSGQTLFETPLKEIDKDDKIYLAEAFVPPDDFFYVAINGHDSGNHDLRRIGATAVQAKVPDIPYLTVPRQIEARARSRVRLVCGVESLVPVTAGWAREDDRLTPQLPSLQSTSVEYVIEAMHSQDAGTYRCEANNAAGAAAATTRLLMKVEPPEVVLRPGDMTVLWGEPLSISCQVFSEDVLQSMQLVFKGALLLDDEVSDVPITPTEDGLYVYNKTIPHVAESDSGLYTCVAINKAGNVTKSMNVTIESKPSVQILGPHSMKRPIHSNIQLACHAENAHRVQWVAPNDTVAMETAVNSTYDGMFEVKNVTECGRWTCVGWRGSYRASDAIDIDLLIKPTAHIEGDKNITIMNGTSRDVTCIVTARPSPRVIWHRETESFLYHAMTQLKDDVYRSVLTLNSSEGVEATYFCIGENAEGIAEDSVVVNVRRMMTLMEGFTDKSVELYSQVDLRCVVDGYPAPTIMWLHNGTDLVPDNQATLHVHVKDLTQAGAYVCVADNGYEKIVVNGTLTVVGLEAPVLFKDQTKVTARRGEPTKLTCRVLQGKPDPSLTWQYRNQSSEDFSGVVVNSAGSELSIPLVDLPHGGVYRCIAENVVDKDTYDVELVVQYPPQISGSANAPAHQETVETEAGGRIQFSCEAKGEPAPLVVWTKNQRALTFSSVVYLTDGNGLVIEKANEYDSGVYTCSAVSAVGSAQKNFTLFVYVPPSVSPAVSNLEQHVVEGQLVFLPCSASGNPRPRIHWARDGNPLMGTKLIDDTGIRFVANITDFGNYTCFAENGYGNASASFLLYVWIPPTASAAATSLSAAVGGNASLQCDAVGFPVPTILWEFRDQMLTANTSVLSFNDYGNVFISNVSLGHEGVYACIAVNVAGEDKKYIYVNVNEPPKIARHEALTYLATNVDKELLITCNASGKPKPFITWSKDGQYLRNDASFAVEYDGSLLIKAPAESLSGLYTCRAHNAAGADELAVPVQIYSAPTRLAEESRAQVVALENSDVSLACPVLAAPADRALWYKDAKLVSSGILHISNVSRTQSAAYACVVNNIAGAAVAYVDLVVEWPPTILEKLADVETIEGNDVYFDCGADANPKAETKWLFNSHPLVFEDKERLKLLSVQTRQTGRYECVVGNAHGTARRQFTLLVLVPPFISEFDYLEVQLKEGSDALLECKAKGTPVPDVKWMFNNSNWHSEGSTLVSQNISLSAAGVFRCVSRSKAGAAHLAYRVEVVAPAKVGEIVLYKGGEGSMVKNKTQVVQGTHARLSCTSSGQPVPKIQWIKSGNVLSENSHAVSNADLVLDVRADHAGVYACAAANGGGVNERKIRLEVLEPPKIFQSLFENENAIGNTVNLEVLSGQYFSMHCHPYGNPVPEVYWFKDGLPLRLFDDKMVSTDFGEVIVSDKAIYEQSGNYTCVARNDVGNTSLVYLVDVLVPPPTPKESIKLSSTRVGRQLNLTCPVEGSPAPIVTWLRLPYAELSEGPRVQLLNDDVTLLINDTKVSDSGLYSCIMTNKVGTTEVVFDVTILMPPSIAGNVGSDVVESHAVPLMRSIVLKCEVKGHPAPNITWLKDTQQLSAASSNIQHVLGSSLLGVWRVTSRAAGQYVCVAANQAGSTHRRYNVAVRVPGKWSAWSGWSYCNATCGLGFQHRSRLCHYTDDDNVTYDKTTTSDKIILDESECKGSDKDKRRCHMPPCEPPPVARWSAWSAWGACSATCGGSQARTRRCKSIQPCYGDNVQIRKCPNIPKCGASAEKREIETSVSGESNTEMDPFLPEAVYEMQPEVIDEHEYKSDVEEFYVKPAFPSSTMFEVNVTSNLDFSPRGPCRPGYTHRAATAAAGNACQDIDECAISNNQCHATQSCANTAGGYRCGCAPGYSSLGPGLRCLDVNECSLETDGCEVACVNVAGGFVCACPRELRLHRDKRHCVPSSAYRQPYMFDDTGDYLSASIDPSNSRKGRS